MNGHLPLYEQLYVVSDLHMGGTQGIRIFHQGAKLEELVNELAECTPLGGGTLALVLNGDIIDTLAENLEHYVASPDDAETIVARIMSHPDFGKVWAALGRFVGQPQHQLVIVVGNHDVELAYPNVQELILERLGGASDSAVRGRIQFATMGVGHACRVGTSKASARVLCVHGNEFDSWNAVSPDNMARLVRSALFGTASHIAAAPPNAGTQLVIDVMNKVKPSYPFVDLLKPEIETVFNVLLALSPSLVKEIPDVLKVVAKAETQGALRVRRVLSGEATVGAAAESSSSEWKPSGHFGEFLEQGQSSSDLVGEAWEASAQNPTEQDEAGDEVLGVKELLANMYNYVKNRITKNPREAVRCALLDWVGGDHSWDLDGPDNVCDKLADLVPGADVVIAGHTHLRRQKVVETAGTGVTNDLRRYLYLNTGTWARLIQLDKALLADSTKFEDYWKTLKEHSMAALEGYTLGLGTVGVVRSTDGTAEVEAAICEKMLGEAELKPVSGADWVPVTTHG